MFFYDFLKQNRPRAHVDASDYGILSLWVRGRKGGNIQKGHWCPTGRNAALAGQLEIDLVETIKSTTLRYMAMHRPERSGAFSFLFSIAVASLNGAGTSCNHPKNLLSRSSLPTQTQKHALRCR